jgi:hypothetical protein
MKYEISRLNLLSPLFYVSEQGLTTGRSPFEYREGEGERLFCFELDEEQYRNFEPDEGKFFENLVFEGKAVDKSSGLELPKGNYLFAQQRKVLSREETSAMAAEIQKEGLWQRLKPGKRLYLRRLFEDGSPVTQLLRPYSD